MQTQSTLDESLLDRADRAARYPTLSQITADYELPSWALGAADVRIIYISSDRRWRTFDKGPTLHLGSPSSAWPAATRTTASARSARAAPATASSPCRPRTGRHWCWRSRWRRRTGCWRGSAWSCCSSVSPASSPPPWPAGRWPATGCDRCASSPARSRGSPGPRTSTPLPIEGDDEIARLATAFNQMLTALAASRDRQRRLVADAGHELRTPLTSLRTNLDLLSQADGERRAPAGGARRAARRRPRADRGAHHADR